MPPPPPEDSGAVDVPESPDAVPPPPADDGYGEAVEDVPAAPEYSEVEERVEVSGVLKDMTWVGFQQTMESSRVFIKTTEPVRFHVTEEGTTLVVLELENTRIPMRNNQRFLDTHFFDTAVTMITPREIEGASRNVRIEIQLRDKVPYTSGQDENMVFLDFQRP
jgi:colicin import membrane protein